MKPRISPSVRSLGYWSAIFSSVFSIAYIIAQLMEWMGLLGSQGGPEGMSTPMGLVWLLTPSLLLGVSFVILMVSIHYCASENDKIWSHLGLTFATAYAVLIGIVYFVQLTLVVPRLMSGDTQDIQLLIFTPFDSFLYAVDILGYSFMSLATLFASRVFTGEGLGKKVRWFLTANGVLIPFLVFQMYYHPLIFIASLWAITFPGSTISLAILFRRQKTVSPERI
ncbi:hypothetical protein [Halalkalibaculum sp. DA384]|uniref:hypothetical protein n=1 Tax=Halalkalibaculum sp. DA384 TaxID=3373606 RepID=UPI00375424C4